MKKYFDKLVMAMLAMILTLGFAACSNDDDDDSGNGSGSMSGWVEIEGKKYDFKYFYGGQYNESGEWGFTGFNKDPYKLGNNDNYNLVNFSMAFLSDGSLDTENGHPAIGFEFNINCNNGNENRDMVMYCDLFTSYDGITAKKSGDKLVIDGKNVEVRYSKKGATGVNQNDPTTKANFHFAGTPKRVDFE